MRHILKARAGDRQFSPHSLRAGFITSAAKANVPEHVIQRTSRHKSVDVLRAYIRGADTLCRLRRHAAVIGLPASCRIPKRLGMLPRKEKQGIPELRLGDGPRTSQQPLLYHRFAIERARASTSPLRPATECALIILAAFTSPIILDASKVLTLVFNSISL